MIAAQFSKEPHYLESVSGLLQLHDLETAGRSESLEAEQIRDSLLAPWNRLTDAQKQRITGLSRDLYVISNPPEPAPMNRQMQAALVEACEARQAGDWDDALNRLRTCEASIDPALCSYLRGQIWLDAGDTQVAAVFFKHASELESGNEKFRLLLHQALSTSASSL